MSILATRTRQGGATGLPDKSGSWLLIVSGSQGAAYRQQLELRTVGNELLDRIQHLDQMRPIGTDRRNADSCPPMQVKMINFGNAELESLTNLNNERTD